jgi:hypothetical protein
LYLDLVCREAQLDRNPRHIELPTPTIYAWGHPKIALAPGQFLGSERLALEAVLTYIRLNSQTACPEKAFRQLGSLLMSHGPAAAAALQHGVGDSGCCCELQQRMRCIAPVLFDRYSSRSMCRYQASPTQENHRRDDL